jgi:hypothetical protein
MFSPGRRRPASAWALAAPRGFYPTGGSVVRDGGQVELVALYWTVSGPVEVHVGREWSLFDWADRCAEARKVGFSGLGIWHADLEHVLQTRSLQEMKQSFDDNGLRHLEVECLLDWFPSGPCGQLNSHLRVVGRPLKPQNGQEERKVPSLGW